MRGNSHVRFLRGGAAVTSSPLPGILLESDQTGATQAHYTDYPGVWGGLVSQRRSGASNYFGFDQQSSARILANSSASITDQYAFKAFGEELSASGSTTNPFRYVGEFGYYRDIPNRLDVRFRHLNTLRGRWLSRDPIGWRAGANRYRYNFNDPSNLIDPSGLLSWNQVVGWYKGGMGGISQWTDKYVLGGSTAEFRKAHDLYYCGQASGLDAVWAGAKWLFQIGSNAFLARDLAKLGAAGWGALRDVNFNVFKKAPARSVEFGPPAEGEAYRPVPGGWDPDGPWLPEHADAATNQFGSMRFRSEIYEEGSSGYRQNTRQFGIFMHESLHQLLSVWGGSPLGFAVRGEFMGRMIKSFPAAVMFEEFLVQFNTERLLELYELGEERMQAGDVPGRLLFYAQAALEHTLGKNDSGLAIYGTAWDLLGGSLSYVNDILQLSAIGRRSGWPECSG